jgi:hypothetical protein
LEKFTAGIDADEEPGPSLVPGEAVVWEYRVKNTGDVPILNVLVTDDPEGWICETGGMDPGAEVVCEHSGTVEIGQYSNTATATATAKILFGTVTVTDQDMSHYFGGENSNGARTVQIDVKPGSDSNRINGSSKGRVPVAILSSGEAEASGGPEALTLSSGGFDPSTVDPETIWIGSEAAQETKSAGSGVAPVHVKPTEDLDGDGLSDLILHFKTQELCKAGLLDTDGTVWVLTGQTLEGELFSGSDVIHLVGGGSCS